MTTIFLFTTAAVCIVVKVILCRHNRTVRRLTAELAEIRQRQRLVFLVQLTCRHDRMEGPSEHCPECGLGWDEWWTNRLMCTYQLN